MNGRRRARGRSRTETRRVHRAVWCAVHGAKRVVHPSSREIRRGISPQPDSHESLAIAATSPRARCQTQRFHDTASLQTEPPALDACGALWCVVVRVVCAWCVLRLWCVWRVKGVRHVCDVC
eukprot:6175725-Pleurochrysis_carterae.AAC.2